MLSMGLQVRFVEVKAAARPTQVVVLGVLTNYLLIPAIAVGLCVAFQADPMTSAGILVLAICPGAPVGPLFTSLARGNMPLAVSMMVILAVFSAILSPALLSLLLTRIAPDSNLHIDFLAIVKTLMLAQMLPLAAGLAIHEWAPRLTKRLCKPLELLANLLLLVLIALILATEYETLAVIRLRGWFGMSLLFMASLGTGWLFGGPNATDRKAMAVTTSSRNAAVGLAIVTSNFAGTPAVTAVVAYGLLSIVGTLICALLIGRFNVCDPSDKPVGL